MPVKELRLHFTRKAQGDPEAILMVLVPCGGRPININGHVGFKSATEFLCVPSDELVILMSLQIKAPGFRQNA